MGLYDARGSHWRDPNYQGSHENPKNIGQATLMSVAQLQAGTLTLVDTQMLSARQVEPRQWLVTLARVTMGPSQVATYPVLGNSAVLQCRMRWGAGAAAFVSEFDYPLAGCTFGLTADTFDLSVGVRMNEGDAPTFASPSEVPFIGAFYVAGTASDSSPLRWVERPLRYTDTNVADYPVRPFARKLRLGWLGGAFDDPPHPVTVVWSDAAGNGRFQDNVYATETVVLDVPADAASVAIACGDEVGLSFVTPEWMIGFT